MIVTEDFIEDKLISQVRSSTARKRSKVRSFSKNNVNPKQS